MVVIKRCCMCNKNKETLDHHLLHCNAADVSLNMVFGLFGIDWIMPFRVVDLLAYSKGLFGRSHSNMVRVLSLEKAQSNQFQIPMSPIQIRCPYKYKQANNLNVRRQYI